MKLIRKEMRLNALRLTNTHTAEDNADLLIVEGYGCHFNKANGNGEIVTVDSFADFFNELRNGGQMPYFNYQHQPDQIIGGWDSIEADETVKTIFYTALCHWWRAATLQDLAPRATLWAGLMRN